MRENCFEVASGLWWVVLPRLSAPMVNCFVLCSQGCWVLIDAGDQLRLSLQSLGRALKAIGVPQRGLDKLLITHRHWDHVGGAALVQERWGGHVLLPEGEEEPVSHSPEQVFSWLALHGVGQDMLAEYANSRQAHHRPWPAAPGSMRAGELLSIGELQLEVVPAYGHSPAHVMIREAGRGWLFTGDVVTGDVGWNLWQHAWETGDALGQYLHTLEMTAQMQAEVVLPGHGAPFSGTQLGGQAQAMAFLHRNRTVEVLDIMGGTQLSGYEVALRSGAFQGTVQTLGEALAVTLPVLYYLEGAGAVRRCEEHGVVRWLRLPNGGAAP